MDQKLYKEGMKKAYEAYERMGDSSENAEELEDFLAEGERMMEEGEEGYVEGEGDYTPWVIGYPRPLL